MERDLTAWEDAARRLLRRIRRPHVLEADTVGTDLRAALQTCNVYDAVLECAARALHRADPRLMTILRRCDIGGEPMKAVADDLHVSPRQFFRYRLALIQALAAEICRVLESRLEVPRDPARAQAVRQIALARLLLDRGGRRTYQRAIEAAETALRHDPSDAVAWSLVVAGHMSRALASVDPISAYGSAIAARARAVELAPRSAVVRSVDALVSLWADRDAVRAGKLAEDALDSRDAAARAHQTLAWIAVRDGAFDDAEHQFNAAVAARPGCWGYHKAAMAVLHIRGDYERCARRCSELSSIEPEDPYVLAYYLESLNALGRYQAAVAVEAAAPPAAKDHAVLAAVIRARAKLGDIEGASRLARHFRGPAVCRAAVALSLGDVDAAWRELEAGAGEPNGMMLLVPTDPVFEPFWNEPRLAKILASAGH